MKIRLFKIIIAIILCVNVLIGYKLYSDATGDQPDDSGYNAIYKLMFAIQKIRKDYVDEKKVSYSDLMKGALKGILRSLDPFCSYMDEKDFKNMVEETEGKEYGGLGIVVTYKNNALKVIAPIDNSPAAKAGIQPGDIITKIDGLDTATLNFDECVKRLKGDPGSMVTLTITRDGAESPLEMTLKRELIEVSSVSGAKIIEDGIAYLRISQFNVPTASDLDKNLEKLNKEGMKGLIIDLRGNPGGLLTSAIEVSSRFLDTGELVVYTEGRAKNSRFDYYSLKCKKKYTDIPIAILVDGFSASASEIVSGCLKDHKRAVLIGEKTFGKGSVQTIIPLPDNSGAIRLTTAKYYTPSNIVIHENGIEPTIEVKITRSERDEIYDQRNSYPGIIKPDKPDTIKDVQLERAVEILKGVCLLGRTLSE
ncbi:MAG: S41 family peptidase [Candidatus Nanoarchaeia archaeon]